MPRRHDESLAPIGKNITKTNLINMVWVSRKFANMYLCQNGLPVTYNNGTNPQFKGYATLASEWENRDNRMRYTLAKPGDTFWDNSSKGCRLTWNDASDQNHAVHTDFIPRSGTGYHNQKWASEREVKDNFEGL